MLDDLARDQPRLRDLVGTYSIATAARDSPKEGYTISAIGKVEGMVVSPEAGKTATTHDLRRTFGTRWAKRVVPATVKELMRHASIDTTTTN